MTDHTHAGRDVVVGAYVVPDAGDRDAAVVQAAAVRDAGADLVVAAMAGPERSAHASTNQSVDLAAACQTRVGVPALATVTTWNRTIMTLQAHLLGAHARGVRRLVCGTGSPPLTGAHPPIDGRWAVDAIGLIELLQGLNEGVDHHGLQLEHPTAFAIGVRVDTTSDDPARARERTRRKLGAGAHFVLTSPVYDPAGLEELVQLVDGAVPVLATVHPLRSADEAALLHRELPGGRVPDALVQRMERAGSAAADVGADIAVELAQRFAGLGRGVVLSAGRPDLVGRVAEVVG